MSFRWDERIWFQNPKVRFIPEFSRYTQRRNDLYWSVNQCFIQPYYNGNNEVHLVLSHTMPNFKTYEYRYEDESVWKTTRNDISLNLHNGKTTVYIRAINDFDRAGAESSVTMVKR